MGARARGRQAAGTSLVALTLLAVVAPASHAAWSPATELAPEEDKASDGSVGVDRAGNVISLWGQFTAQQDGLKARIDSPAGTSRIQTLARRNASTMLDLNVTPRGDALVTYSEGTLDFGKPFVGVLRRPGGRFESAQRLGRDSAYQSVVGPNGDVVVAYNEQNARLRVRTAAPDARFDKARQLQSSLGVGVSLAMGYGGRAAIAWTRRTTRSSTVLVALRTGRNRPWRITRVSPRGRRAGRAAVALSEDGTLIVAYQQRRGRRFRQILATTYGVRSRWRRSAITGYHRTLTPAAVAGTYRGTFIAVGTGPRTGRRLVAARQAPGSSRLTREVSGVYRWSSVPALSTGTDGGAVAWVAGGRDRYSRDTPVTSSAGGPFADFDVLPMADALGFGVDEIGQAFGAWRQGANVRTAMWRVGKPLASVTQIGRTRCGLNTRFASSPLGAAAVVLTGDCGSEAPSRVVVSRRRPGRPFLTPEPVSTKADDIGFGSPRVAVNDGGTVAAQWEAVGSRPALLQAVFRRRASR